MTSRKTLKLEEETKGRLDGLKDGETWDGLLNSMADAYEEQQRRAGQQGPPACTQCGSTVTTWTIIDGNAVCEDCADFEFGV